MEVPSEYRADMSSQKRRPKGSRSQQQQQQQQFYSEFDVQNQQHQAPFRNVGQQDMYYSGQGYSQPGYGGPAPAGLPQFPGQQFLNEPLTNMAMQYGQVLAGQGKDLVNQNIQQYVTSSKMKYYFAVDTAYVGKKLGLLFFPYTHSDWSVHYNQDEPVAPRYEINAPDLYIPVMAFVTYVLVTGMVLGIQGRFTPEQLGVQASTALVWLIIELVAFFFSLYVTNLSSGLKYLDITAFCGYKFVGMTISMLAGVAGTTAVYYGVLSWFCLSLVFFLMRTLKVQILPHQGEDGYNKGLKRSLYFILSVSLAQPFLMWWLTSSVMIHKSVVTAA